MKRWHSQPAVSGGGGVLSQDVGRGRGLPGPGTLVGEHTTVPLPHVPHTTQGGTRKTSRIRWWPPTGLAAGGNKLAPHSGTANRGSADPQPSNAQREPLLVAGPTLLGFISPSLSVW